MKRVVCFYTPEPGNFLSLGKLQDLYKVRTNFLTYHGIVAAIKRDIGIKGIESKKHNLSLPLMPRHIKMSTNQEKDQNPCMTYLYQTNISLLVR